MCRKMRKSYLGKRSKFVRPEERHKEALANNTIFFKEDELWRTSGPGAGVVVGGVVVGTLSGAVEGLHSVGIQRDSGAARDDPSPLAVHKASWVEIPRARLPKRRLKSRRCA